MRERWGRKGKKKSKQEKAEKLRNKKLIKKYYFLKPTSWRKYKRNRRVPKYDYSYINWFGWPGGWNAAFGIMYLKELGEEIKRSGQKNFSILQQKEKYGRCINYVSGTTQAAHEIIDKYERISEGICWDCGKPDVPMIDDGWVHPVCLDCFIKAEHHRDEWYKKHHDDYVAKTDKELTEMYKKAIIDKPNENGEYPIPDTYITRSFGKDDYVDTTHDISKTVQDIREHYKKMRAKYEKRICNNRHTS